MRRANDIARKLEATTNNRDLRYALTRRRKTGDGSPVLRHPVRQLTDTGAAANSAGFKKYLKVSAATAFQPLGVSQTLKVSEMNRAIIAATFPTWGEMSAGQRGLKITTSTLPRESFAWLDTGSKGSSKTATGAKKFADGRVNLATGDENLANGSKTLSGGNKKTADGRLRLPGDTNNLPIAAFKLPFVGLNCRLPHLNCQLSAQTANGELRLPGDGSNSSVGTKNCPGTAQTARWEQKTAGGQVNSTWGAVDMRVLELFVSNTSRTERHLKVSQAMTIQPLGVFETLKVSETEPSSVISTKDEERSVATEHQTICHPEGGTTERSVTLEQHRNRFSAYRFTSRMGWQAGSSLFGMTDKICFHHLTAVNAVPSSWKEEKLKLAASGSHLKASLSTIKYNNPPLRRIAGTTKNAHLSKTESMGTGDINLFPFFLISKHALKCEQFSPLGEMPAGQRGGIVANTNKTSAYET